MTADVDILVVDDRAEDRLAIESMLTTSDYNIVTASTGRNALRRILERDFAVILLDVVMPDIDGLEVARIIKQRERSRHTPVIFLTAADPDLRQLYRGYAVGAIDYLTKPIDPDVLRAKTAIFVELFRKDRRIRAQAEALREADRRELASVVLAGRRRYENLAEAMPEIVWIAEPDGKLVYANRRWTEYTGEPLELTRERGVAGALEPDDVTAWCDEWESARRRETVLDVECRVRRHDGAMRWHLCRAVPERDADGRVVAWLGTLTDYDDLHRAYESAESAVRARDAFLSLASHELRTPLTTLQLRLRSLRRRVEDGERASAEDLSRLVSSALGQSDRLVRLVDDLLDVARIATGRLTLQEAPFDLRDAVHDVVDRFQELAQEAKCPITVRAPRPVEGRWDRLRLEQAVQNLLANALRYAPGGPVEIEVDVEQDDATVRVRDHGPGIPEPDRARIFDRFERVTRAGHADGLGLGLHIVREIAVSHGGGATVEGAAGGGAVFTLRVPLAAPRTLTAPHRDDPPSARTSRRGLRATGEHPISGAANGRATR